MKRYTTSGGTASITVSTMVGTAKKLCNLVFCLYSRLRKKQIDEAINKIVNVMEIIYLYENFFGFTKKFLLILTLWGFFEIFFPNLRWDVFN